MSHFYNKKSYSFSETDEMMTEIKQEMSNFITKEEAELILNRRYALIDPVPNRDKEIYFNLMSEINLLRMTIDKMGFELEEIKKKLNE